jgi:hypothetical protein
MGAQRGQTRGYLGKFGDMPVADANAHAMAWFPMRVFAPARREVAEKAWDRNRAKPMELCNTLQRSSWGYNRSDDGKTPGA